MSGSDLVLYRTEDGRERIEVRLEGETVWLSQGAMAELFETTVPNINTHLKNLFSEEELTEEATIKEYLIVRQEGAREVQRSAKHYSLEAIIAVGYRVRSRRGTQFRRWATERLREYLVKGFVMDDERLKAGSNIGSDYFDELLERIRDIRASEKRFYQKIRDIYALAVDYDSSAEETQLFFRVVQNKLHFAISGKTAAELIAKRADASKPNMGLTSWKGAVVRKGDVTVAKNYLNGEEDSGAQSHHHHVPGLCRRPGQAPTTDLPKRLARQTRFLPETQRPRRTSQCRPHQEGGRRQARTRAIRIISR